MTGEKIETAIFDWFDRMYDSDDAMWQSPDFHCYADAPQELRLICACTTLESNISNGGWSQVLWNCFGTWRQLLDLAAEGYELVGAPHLLHPIDLLRQQFAKNEAACRRLIARARRNEDFSYFGEFQQHCQRHGLEHYFSFSKPFWSEPHPHELRRAWLEQNQRSIQRLIGK